MAEESLFNQGVPFAAGVSGGLNPYAGVQRELARADQKKAEGEERAFKLAGMIKQADPSQLFGKHYSIANQWASALFDQVGDYSKSSAKSMEFLAQANALVGYINSKKQYKTANMGDPNDELTTPTYYGRVKRKASGVNAFEANDKKEVEKDFDSVLSNLNKPVQAFSLGENGPMIDDGDGLVSLADYQDPDAPFMFELEDDLNMPVPGEWYEGWAKSRGKITDASASAAKSFFKEKVQSGDVNLRKLMNWWKTQGTREEQEIKGQKTIDELLEDPSVVDAAARAFAVGVEQKWDDLYKEEEEANAMEMFGTGQAALMDRDGNLIGRTFTGQTDATGIFDLLGAPTADQLESGEYNENWYVDSEGFENESLNIEELGFTNLMMFNSDEDNDFVVTVDEAPDLGRDEVIDAVNVDSRGNIYARVISVEDKTLEDGSLAIGPDGKTIPEEVRDIRVYSIDDANNAMFLSLQSHINQGNANQYQAMWGNSIDAAKAARRARVKLKIDAARARADEAAAAAGTADPATTPEEAAVTPEEAASNNAPPTTPNERPPVIQADVEKLNGIISNPPKNDVDSEGNSRAFVDSDHLKEASENLLNKNYSHAQIVAAYQNPMFDQALRDSDYSGTRGTSRGLGGRALDALAGGIRLPFGNTGPIGGGSAFTRESGRLEAVLESVIKSGASNQPLSPREPQSPPSPDPIVTDEAPTAEAPTERDFSGLPEISNVSASASRGVALSEGYSSDKSINVPGGNSGVTVGGIDLGSVAGNEDIKLKILKPFVSQEDYKALEGLAGLIGDEAEAGLKAAQDKGLLDPKTLISSDADLQSIVSYGIESFVLPSIYKHIPKEDFESLPSAVTDVLINVQFMTPGEEVLKAAVKANNKDKKSAWLKVADLYYKPVVERDSMEQEKDDLLKYTDNDDLLSVDAPYKSTYYGDAKKTDTKLDNYKNKKEGKKILPGNVKRVLEARWQLLDWINNKYGNE